MQHSTLFCFSALQPVTRWEVPLCRKSHSAQIVCSCHVGHSCQCQTMQVLQNGPRGRREREFYERVRSELRTEKAARLRLAAQASVSEDVSDEDDQASVSGRSDDESDAQTKLPFSVRNAAMLATVPRFCEYLSSACCMVAVFRSRGLSLSTCAWILFESSRADIAGIAAILTQVASIHSNGNHLHMQRVCCLMTCLRLNLCSAFWRLHLGAI